MFFNSAFGSSVFTRREFLDVAQVSLVLRLLDQADDAYVDILVATSLAAVDGEDVLAGFERGAALGRQWQFLVICDVDARLAGEHAVDVNLDILIVMPEQVRILNLPRPASRTSGATRCRRSSTR